MCGDYSCEEEYLDAMENEAMADAEAAAYEAEAQAYDEQACAKMERESAGGA